MILSHINVFKLAVDKLNKSNKYIIFHSFKTIAFCLFSFFPAQTIRLMKSILSYIILNYMIKMINFSFQFIMCILKNGNYCVIKNYQKRTKKIHLLFCAEKLQHLFLDIFLTWLYFFMKKSRFSRLHYLQSVDCKNKNMDSYILQNIHCFLFSLLTNYYFNVNILYLDN